jgi:hypothetical protein
MPRPSQPLITVSLSPDNLSEYKDLFFPRPVAPPQDSNDTPSPTPPPNSRLPKSDLPTYPRRGQTPASAIAAARRQATCDGDDRSLSRSSRYFRKNSDSGKGLEETPGPSVTQESPQVTPDGEKGLPPSLQRHPSSGPRFSANVNSPSIRSRMKPLSNAIRSRPPSIPPPQTPMPSTPLPDVPPFFPLPQKSNTELQATSAQKLIARPRAHTIGSVGNSPLPADQPTPNTTATLSPPSMDVSEVNFDIDTASAPQLRASLRTRNQQYEEFASYVHKVTETHVTEVTNLEKKILVLEKEVARKDKELKGLRWIINNGDSPQPQPPERVLNHSLLPPTSTLSESEDNSRIIPGASRRFYYQSDSGTESHADSESVRSAASFCPKSLRKPSNLTEITYNFCHTGSTRRPSKMPPTPGAEKIPKMPNKRLSLSSVSSSPPSSTSSLLTPSPSPSITMSSLSAIPEIPPPYALRPSSLRYDNSDPEERRALCASHHASTSSMTSESSTTQPRAARILVT